MQAVGGNVEPNIVPFPQTHRSGYGDVEEMFAGPNCNKTALAVKFIAFYFAADVPSCLIQHECSWPYANSHRTGLQARRTGQAYGFIPNSLPVGVKFEEIHVGRANKTGGKKRRGRLIDFLRRSHLL